MNCCWTERHYNMYQMFFTHIWYKMCTKHIHTQKGMRAVTGLLSFQNLHNLYLKSPVWSLNSALCINAYKFQKVPFCTIYLQIGTFKVLK